MRGTAVVTGKGYVDGVHDDIKLKQSIMPAASATGLFIFLESAPNPQSKLCMDARGAKFLERR